MKKILLLVLCALMLLTTACGCASGSETIVKTAGDDTTVPADDTLGTSDSTTAPVEEDILDSLGERDFGGRVFTILDANDYPEMHINMPGKEMSGDTIEDAIYLRDAAIEERYRCEIEYVQITNATNGITSLTNSYHAGDKSYDICISTVSGGRLATLATQGILANLCDIEALSLQANWWSKLIYENCRLADRMYFTTGDIAPAMYDAPACAILNRRLLDENQITTDFYQLVRDGLWTVDELMAVTKDADRDLNNDGIMHADHDFFGLIYQNNSLCSSMMMVGCGVSLCTVQDDEIIVDLNNERTMNVTEKLAELTNEVKYNDQQDTIRKAFKEDRVLAAIHVLESPKYNLRDMESDYIILPMPKYDTEQEEYRSMVSGWVDCFVGIPNNVDTAEVGFFAEALARESYRAVRPQTYELVFKLKGVREEGSSEMIDVIFNSLYLDFCEIYNFGDMPSVMQQVIFQDASFASTVSARKKLLENTINKFVNSWIGE